MSTLSLVIPAYNEEARLPALLDSLSASAEGAARDAGFELHETLIVDDGSSDGTKSLLRQAEAQTPKLKPVLEFSENRGKGAAVAAGVQRAEGDYVLVADVDLSTPLKELGKLAKEMQGDTTIVIGSRAIAGAVVERGPAHRKLLGKGFNGAVRLLTGLHVHDTQCGFKLLPTRVAKRLLTDQICPGFAFDVELLMRADLEGLRIVEVPVLYLHDSRSRVRVASASFQMLRDVCGLAYRLRLRRRVARSSSGRLAGLPADDSD